MFSVILDVFIFFPSTFHMFFQHHRTNKLVSINYFT